tara:strand:- start:2932 stop:3141 length:210 start_codon:yes stop_codon:yes gene_type:complete
MTVTLNGKSIVISHNPGEMTVTQFISTLELGNQPVLVELNGTAILAREFDDYRINEGDILEVIRMVAGG